jgi:hypothetical protein
VYAVYVAQQRLVVYHRVEYDIPGAQKKILAAGLPELLAKRLETGN